MTSADLSVSPTRENINHTTYERLKLLFAILSGLGGLVLLLSSENDSTPFIAVFFAVFGYIFVDWLRIFSLPPIIAYAAMAVTAVYSTSDILLPLLGGESGPQRDGNNAVASVAQLLVLVQAILMLQKKNRRIFEQLGVFCLLDLVVAAVFGNTIAFGFLMIPLCITAAFALSLLAVVSASEGLSNLEGPEVRTAGDTAKSENTTEKTITITSTDGATSIAAAARRLPLLAIFSVGPSVIMLAAVFFYLLPRITNAARDSGQGNALVGFNDQVNLKQIGKMQQNPAIALRAKIVDAKTGKPYKILGDLYLRGKVLENYEVQPTRRGFTSAQWTAIAMGRMSAGKPLPRDPTPPRSVETNFFDVTNFDITCSAMRTPSLFAPAPYHRESSQNVVVHLPDRWTLKRKAAAATGRLSRFSRLRYSFASNAFKDGLQTELIARFALGDAIQQRDPLDTGFSRMEFSEGETERYESVLLEYDIDAIPSAALLSERFGKRRESDQTFSDYRLAKAMERYLATSPDFSYTLDLSAKPIAGLDPLEQFLSVDKRGHCQYFAAALVMMLRSQGIPSRIVVGYKTNEYNDLAKQYVARQMHAHAWVEALIDRDQLNPNRNVFGQPKSQQYWLRLDPTPSTSSSSNQPSRVTQVLDVAQNAWEDYVVDMDQTRQETTLLGRGITPMNSSYDRFVAWLRMSFQRLKNGTLLSDEGGRKDIFSVPAAILGFLLTLFAVFLLRVPLPKWIKRRIQTKRDRKIMRPSVDFYARTLDQLVRLGINRTASQTPAELLDEYSNRPQDTAQAKQAGLIHQHLSFLTEQFYVRRFRGDRIQGKSGNSGLDPNAVMMDAAASSESIDQALRDLTRNVDELLLESSRTKSSA